MDNRPKTPQYYIGDGRMKGRPINRPDVERNANGSVSGKRDKAARRMLRGLRKQSLSRVEVALDLPRAMQSQAAEVMKAPGRQGGRAARRLFERVLAIHQPRPNKPTRQQRKAAARLEARAARALLTITKKEP